MELLERERQREALLDYAADARRGCGRLVLIAGEAGAGKTALLERVEREVADARWAWGACDPLVTPRPLEPLRDVAAKLSPEVDGLCRRSARRDRIFDAVLAALAAAPPVVVMVVEDAHWADDATLDLLRFLGRRVRDLHAMVVVTYRDDELPAGNRLREALGQLLTHACTRRIEVPALSEEAVSRLAEGSTFGAQGLHRLTGGNPFFVTEMLRSASAPPTSSATDPGLPSSVRDVVLARADRLSPPARAALDAAALIGPRVRPSLLLRVSGAGPRAIDEMLTCGVMRADGSGMAFRHELARRAVEGAIAPHVRQPLHARILEALLRDGEEDEARLAFHAEAADDGDAAVRHALRAARQAAALGSHSEALGQYERVARFSARFSLRERGELWDALATEAAHVDQGRRAAEARGWAIEVWREAGDPLREGDSLAELVGVLQRTAHGEAATSAAERAVLVLEPLGETDELARAVRVLAGNRVMNGRHEEAISLIDRAVLLGERRGLPDVLSDALNTRGCALRTVGRDGMEELHAALRVALEHGLRPQAGRAYVNLHVMLVGALRFAEAEDLLAEGFDYCDARDLVSWGWCLRCQRFNTLERTGHWAEAVALCDEVLSSTVSVWNRIRALETAAILRARRGEPGARQLLEESTLGVLGIGEPQFLVPNAVAKAELNWLEDDLGAARAVIAAVEPLADQVGIGDAGPLAVWTRRLRGITLEPAATVASPYRAELEGRLDDAVREWDALGCPYEPAVALAFSVQERHLREAITRLDRLGAPETVRAVRRRMRELGIRSIPAGSRSATRANPAGLTRREQEVLERLCEELSNEQIARRLVLSVRTVDHHVSSVLNKLAVASRGDAVAAARRLGLVHDRSET